MEIENADYNFMEPETYNEKIEQLNGAVNLLLDEFKKIYVISKMHPANQEYQQQYANIVTGLEQLQSKLFSTSNDIRENIEQLNKEIISRDVQIKQEREKNKELKNKMGIVENKTNAASEMINDFTKIYDETYLRNWALGLSTIACIITIGSLFKKQGV